MGSDRKASVLIVDDEERLCLYLRKEFIRKGYACYEAHDRAQALSALARERVDVVLLDIVLPGAGGLEVLRELRSEHPWVQVLMLTGNAAVGTAVESMKLGAYDYLAKPYSLEELCLLVDRATAEARMRRQNEALRFELARHMRYGEFVGESPQAAALRALVGKLAPASSPVLIRGETGTGKEFVARLLHREGPQSNSPFVAVDCAERREAALESDLFGHERGAVPGAAAAKKGLVEIADGGTVYLDDLVSLPAGTQAKLLRLIDRGEFRRLGGARALVARVRVVGATSQDPAAAVREGRLREDLLSRLAVHAIEVPPLRERREDIYLLAERFFKRHRGRQLEGPGRLAPAALERLAGYSWPGNVRQLENVIERAVVLAGGEAVEASDLYLPPDVAGAGEPPGSLAAVEKAHVLRILASTNGNRARAAAILGVDVKTLYNKLKDYAARKGV